MGAYKIKNYAWMNENYVKISREIEREREQSWFSHSALHALLTFIIAGNTLVLLLAYWLLCVVISYVLHLVHCFQSED